VVLVVVVLAVIATGLIVPGRTGDLIAAGGLIAFAGIVIFEIGGIWSVRPEFAQRPDPLLIAEAQTPAGSFTSVRRMLLPEGSRKPESMP
jgi:hypothetical protein